MGNKDSTMDYEYMAIKNEEKDKKTTKSIPIKTVTPKQIEQPQQSQLSELQQLIKDINGAKTKEDIQTIFALYSVSETVILEFYGSDSMIKFLHNNDSKSKILASLLPKNDNNLISKYFERKIPYHILLLMGDNLNYNFVNDDKETFLYKTWADSFSSQYLVDIDYVIELLSNIDNININHKNSQKKTFLMHQVTSKLDKKMILKFIEIAKILETKNYNFNIISVGRNSLLSLLLLHNGHLVFYFSKLLLIEKYDITVECKWLYIIIHEHLDDIHNYVYYMFKRSDYKRLLHDIFNNYHYPSCEDDFIHLLLKCEEIYGTEMKEALEYKDTDDNTVIHLMANRQCKKLLNFVLGHFNLNIQKNKFDKTPFDLYTENNVKNKLKMLNDV